MKVKVGYMDFAVRPMTPPLSDAETAVGGCNTDRAEIHIGTMLDARGQASCLIHELIHAMFYVFAIPKKDLCEEDVCRNLEGAFSSVIRDNPKLVKTLEDALRDGKAIVEESKRK